MPVRRRGRERAGPPGPRPRVALMPLQALFHGRLDDYVAANRDAPGTLWYFIHIPKTAGSSFRGELAARLKPQMNVRLDRANDGVAHKDKLHQAVCAFLADPRSAACRFASGH